MTYDFSKVAPREADPDGLNAQFYDHASGGILHLQRCTECGLRQHPPRHRCRSCFSERVEWVPSDGVGTLYSWTVTHFPFDRGWAPALPYWTGVIELPDGIRLVGAMDGEDWARLDMPVRVVVVVRGDGMPMLSIVPVPEDRSEDSSGTQGHPRSR